MWMIPIHGNRTLRLAKKIHTRIDNLLLDVLLPLDLEETLPLLGESSGLPLSHSLVLESVTLGLEVKSVVADCQSSILNGG